jgi:hypothetical protein
MGLRLGELRFPLLKLGFPLGYPGFPVAELCYLLRKRGSLLAQLGLPLGEPGLLLAALAVEIAKLGVRREVSGQLLLVITTLPDSGPRERYIVDISRSESHCSSPGVLDVKGEPKCGFRA